MCAIGTMDPDSGVFELSTTDKTTYPHGTYQVDIEGSVSGYPARNVIHTFSYTFNDPCREATLSIPATVLLSDDTYFLTEPSLVQYWELDSNLVEVSLSLDCGDISIDFSQSKDNGPLEPLDTDLFIANSEAKSITVQSEDKAKAGTYVISYEASLVTYPGVAPVTNPKSHTLFIEAYELETLAN